MAATLCGVVVVIAGVFLLSINFVDRKAKTVDKEPVAVLPKLVGASSDESLLTTDAKIVLDVKSTGSGPKFDFSNLGISNAALKGFDTNFRATRLDLSNNPKITDEGMVHLAKLSSLDFLNLSSNPAISDTALQLIPLSKLNDLQLSWTAVSDAGVAKLVAGAKQLKALALEGTQITDAALRSLNGLHELRMLNLNNAGKITGVGFSQGRMAKLRDLYLDKTAIGDGALKSIANIRDLRILSISHTRVTDEGLHYLQDLHNLRTLTMKGCEGVSAAAIEELKRKNVGLTVSY